MNPEIFFVAGLFLALFCLSSRKERRASLIPVPLLPVSLCGITSWFLQLPQEYLFHLPLDIFQHGTHIPLFSEAWHNQDLWMAFVLTIITFTVIDGTEWLTTIPAFA